MNQKMTENVEENNPEVEKKPEKIDDKKEENNKNKT